MKESYPQIDALIEENNGIASYKILIEAGIKKSELQKRLKSRELVLLTYGGYAVRGREPDDFTILQSKSKRIVFSNSTALYLLGMINYRPKELHVKVKNEYRLNLSKTFSVDGEDQKEKNDSIRIHYDKTDFFDMGIELIKTPGGGTVNCYDKERIVCDVIKKKVDISKKERIEIIKTYFKNDYNKRILDYAKRLNIFDVVEEYRDLCL